MTPALDDIANAKLKRYSEAIAAKLQGIPSADFQPDDYPAEHVWDLWKLEMQEDESASHDALEQTIMLEAWGFVDALPWDEVAFLSLMLDPDYTEDDRAAANNDLVVEHLCSELNSLASNEPHRPEIQAMLDGQALDRFERDTEGL
ncbi:MAG: hypothetical protein IT431_05170 [Phycisphaerales bacterium]|nr:hypothetical protein [Phycisphaerales bacterium]